MIGWHFKEKEKGIPERNPRETEFFRITRPNEAVVREFIQNSLDARNNQKQINIKISFNSVRRQNITTFLDNTLKSHLKPCGFIKDVEYPLEISYLLLEDFNTTGLDGPYEPNAEDGNFYNFWWREGISDKSGQRGGRWGLGKTTYHIISKIRTFWGLTIRNDGKILLMGKVLLKAHSLNGKRYEYFGYFAQDDFMPLENYSIISQFRNNFGISRKDTETGLSIVIPIIDDEISFDSMTKGVIQQYYYPILAGTLNVEIQDTITNKDIVLNSENLVEKASCIDWNDTDWGKIDIRKILLFLKETLNIKPSLLLIQEPDNPHITKESFGDQIEIIKDNFLLEMFPLRIKVPVTIRTVDNKDQETFFEVFLKRISELTKPFEAYIRSGILISEIKSLVNSPVAGFLIANDLAVSEFLGDCENPAHTNWNERTEGFANKYVNSARILRFIKKSIIQIVSILDEPPPERQTDFLEHIFSIPVGPEERKEEEEISKQPVIPVDIMKNTTKFNIDKVQGGFRVILNPYITDLSFPFNSILKMAYDTRRSNPFNAYDKFDFDVGSASIAIKTQDCNIIHRQYNILKVEIMGFNFELKVTGFDPNRDLVLDIK